MVLATRDLEFFLTTSPSPDDVHWAYKEHEEAPRIDLCQASYAQIFDVHTQIVFKPTKSGASESVSTCRHCDLIAGWMSFP